MKATVCEEYSVEALWQLFSGKHSSRLTHNFISAIMPSSIYSGVANEIINDEELNKEISDLLKEGFTSLSPHAWDAAVSDYIHYLVAWVIGNGLGIKTVAPFHVDILWCMHLVETVSYRNLEKIVIMKVKDINKDIVLVDHIDHTKHDKKNSRIKSTRTLYTLLGFSPWNEETVSDKTVAHESVESVHPKSTVSTKKQETEKKKAAKQVVISSKGDGDKKEKDSNLALILKLTGGFDLNAE